MREKKKLLENVGDQVIQCIDAREFPGDRLKLFWVFLSTAFKILFYGKAELILTRK